MLKKNAYVFQRINNKSQQKLTIFKYLVREDASITLVAKPPMILLHVNKDKDVLSC